VPKLRIKLVPRPTTASVIHFRCCSREVSRHAPMRQILTFHVRSTTIQQCYIDSLQLSRKIMATIPLLISERPLWCFDLMLDGRLIVSRRRPDTRLTTLSLAKSTITQQPVLRWADLRRYVLIKLCKPASSIGAPRAIGVDQKSKLKRRLWIIPRFRLVRWLRILIYLFQEYTCNTKAAPINDDDWSCSWKYQLCEKRRTLKRKTLKRKTLSRVGCSTRINRVAVIGDESRPP
jgi:hypothetical protein